MTALNGTADALLELLQILKAANYDFVVPTPTTHERVVRRPDKREANDLRGVFGWNLPFAADRIPAEIFDALVRAGALVETEGGYRSLFRVARLGDKLFLHSAFPTDEADAVFFGPDSYRFARFLCTELAGLRGVERMVDFGAGAGAGALTAAAFLPGAHLIALDSNPRALELARINARAAGIEIETIEGSRLADVSGSFDLVIANPPFMMDGAQRTYRHGGGMHGAQLTFEWAKEAAARLAPGGRMLLYSGSAIVDGRDQLRQALNDALQASGCSLRYEELDPDIFGEQLSEPGYGDVERLAAIGAVVCRS